MVLSLIWQALVQDPCHHLPEDLHQANDAEIPFTLQYQNGGLAGALFPKVTLPEGVLDQINNLIPVGGVQYVFPR